MLLNFKSLLQLHGRDWKQLGRAVPNKTETQIKNYFQNYKSKVCSHAECGKDSLSDSVLSLLISLDSYTRRRFGCHAKLRPIR